MSLRYQAQIKIVRPAIHRREIIDSVAPQGTRPSVDRSIELPSSPRLYYFICFAEAQFIFPVVEDERCDGDGASAKDLDLWIYLPRHYGNSVVYMHWSVAATRAHTHTPLRSIHYSISIRVQRSSVDTNQY